MGRPRPPADQGSTARGAPGARRGHSSAPWREARPCQVDCGTPRLRCPPGRHSAAPGALADQGIHGLGAPNTEVVVPIGRGVVVAVGAAHVRRIVVVPTAAAHHTTRFPTEPCVLEGSRTRSNLIAIASSASSRPASCQSPGSDRQNKLVVNRRAGGGDGRSGRARDLESTLSRLGPAKAPSHG